MMVYFYVPLPSLALNLSSFDLHLLHLSALGAFDAPHFMQIFLFNNRFSASGNLAICDLPWFIGNEHIIFKYDVKFF